MFRYIAICWAPQNAHQSSTANKIIARLDASGTHWRVAYQSPGLEVRSVDSTPSSIGTYPLSGDKGVVLGTLFLRDEYPEADKPAKQANFDDHESIRITESGGRRLIDGYWGDYVAFINDRARSSKYVLKDPTGHLPCLRIEHGGVNALFSNIQDCINLNLFKFTLNWEYVSNFIVGGWTNSEIRTLHELDELTRGECIAIDSTSNKVKHRSLYWKPSTFLETTASATDPAHTATLLRRVVRHCVRSWASAHQNLVLRLSGGLDSSIVLGCLRGAGPTVDSTVTCVTYYGTNPGSDPRPWARLAATHAKVEHVETPVNAARTSLEVLLESAATPAPSWLLAHYLSEKSYGEVVRQRSATAVFNGDGGDSSFGSLSIGRSIDDSIARRGFGFHTLRLAAAIAAYRDSTITRVLIDAVRRRYFGTRLQENSQLFQRLGQLAPFELQKRALEAERFPHPWFEDESGVPWGLIYRVSPLLMRPEFYDPLVPSSAFQALNISPIQSQPTVEACLGIPLDIHFLKGVDRGLARRAFAPDVPKEILRRQWKDRAGNTNSEIVTQNLDFLRSLLIDGVLMREGLLDRTAVINALSSTPTKRPADLTVILHYMHIELWVRQWQSQAALRAA